jgi:hypothetical protein
MNPGRPTRAESRERIRDAILAFVKKHGRAPTTSEFGCGGGFNRDKELPEYKACQRVFGSLRAAYEAAGLPHVPATRRREPRRQTSTPTRPILAPNWDVVLAESRKELARYDAQQIVKGTVSRVPVDRSTELELAAKLPPFYGRGARGRGRSA